MTDQKAKLILNEDATEFLNQLHHNFNQRIGNLLDKRKEFYQNLQESSIIKIAEPVPKDSDEWKCAPPPLEIQDRRVEITGPPDRKMIINALNSGANVYMCDFEDSNSPTWKNCIEGQINLRDAVKKTIEHTNPKNGKKYNLNDKTAVLFVRPRGLHLEEKNYLIDESRIRACLFDFGLYFIHNYAQLIKDGSRPYFYLPKLEHAREAKLWSDIFTFAEKYVGVDKGTIKATVLIETLPAVFQMDEILYALQAHSIGLNCGRWDYIFSFIKSFRHDKNFILPDRSSVGMDSHFMRTYSQSLINICHNRGTFAMGGMSAQIPNKNNAETNHQTMEQVRADKRREVLSGHDGTWVAHPALVSVAKEIFDKHLTGANQIQRKISLTKDVSVGDLITAPIGMCTEKMLRENINILFSYMHSWLGGNGCVAINYLMEDAATAEISRAQIWQWLQNKITLDNRVVLNDAYFNQVLREETEKYRKNKNFETVFSLTKDMCLTDNLDDFLTLKCYELID